MNLWSAMLVARLLVFPASDDAPGLEGNCRFTPTRGCECFLSSVETPLSFGEAAGIVEIYHRQFPDDRFEALLIRLFRACSLDPYESPKTITPKPAITQDAMAPQHRSEYSKNREFVE
ncbi:hypothetical protein [Methylobacterium sp. SyP6R]|uniref:hypothetical protein n=1 Tax=Methylobacterium sp. SyP6R TaxID=2718876 RepID=UPI001F2DE103|nr:hypothetical protein [Methylobacterium sp. SyP6R]MCF4130001.1 hypothetical protein [Methylobacterium sp. SyP6R]